ncbi:MAG TPA: acetyl-CoA acetyltransferase [Burkholderiaceae bacterium]|nr:acetyl-CoA acetyltransferase [Burkholderiaceae bacterium]
MIDADRIPCITGIGQTAYTRWGGTVDRSEFSLACEAILAAIADAGLRPDDIDGIASYSSDRNEPAMLQRALGIEQVRFASMVWGGGGGGACGGLAHAAAAIESGRARHVVVFRALCQGQQFRFGRFHPWTPETAFTAPFGLFSPPQMAALVVQRHMHLYGTTSVQLGRVAIACRANATRNPAAVMRDRPITMEDYLASRMIASPLRLLDCCLESDGAAAIVVSGLASARDARAPVIEILAAAQGSERGWGTGLLGGHNQPVESYATGNSTVMARELFARAGVMPDDLDVAQVYDAFTGTVLIALEDYGLCGRGESGPFVEAGHVDWPDGRLPINTSGGNLSEAYIHGFNLTIEAVRQLRGTSTSQVDGARVCLVTGGQAVSPVSGAILGAR